MNTNKMREQFEQWAKDRYSWHLHDDARDPQERTLATWNGDAYGNRIVEGMWQAWQASREAVVVELQEPDLPEAYIDEPVDRESEEFRYLEARHGAQHQTYRKCRQAIEAQGLKVEVKP